MQRSSDGTIGTVLNTDVASGGNIACDGHMYFAPASGSDTYYLSMSTTAGTVDMLATAFGTDPGEAQLTLIDLGPTP